MQQQITKQRIKADINKADENSDVLSQKYIGKTKARTVNAAAGNVKFPFIDITKGKIIKTDGKLIFEMTLLEIPPTLDFNHARLKDNICEYAWEVIIHTNGYFPETYKIAATHFKFPGSQPVSRKILEGTQRNVWKRDLSGNFYIKDMPFTIIQNANTLVFSLTDNNEIQLNDKSSFQFGANHSDGNSSNRDETIVFTIEL